MPLTHPVFEIVTTTAGAISIRNKIVNEIMHNPVGPWIEANSLYIEQSQLKEKLEAATSELVVFDIGLGAAANALAVLHCARSVKPYTKKLRLISFEKDLELLKFALLHADKFAHFSGFESILEEILANKYWSDGIITWELRHGDFLEAVNTETCSPHLIYFDPYSPQMNKEMWSMSTFKKLHKLSRNYAQGATTLYTYSQATPIRAALLIAGFFVGKGEATGLKSETTQAATVSEKLARPLDNRWLERWKRSGTPYPFDCKPEEQEQMKQIILEHPQFNT